MTGLYFILKDHTPVAADPRTWAKWFETSERHVASTKLPNDVHVSTVFMGIDHSFGTGSPLLFETMIFGGPHDEYQKRYTTWEDAEVGHKKAVKLATAKAVTK